MKFSALSLITSLIFLNACEMGDNPNGPYKSYLLLKTSNEKVARFYLGGYKKLDLCVQQVKYETDNAYAGRYFWTNDDYTYGGREQDGWIKHEIIGVVCETEDAYKGWKVIRVEDQITEQ